jgi:hypothetical protein
MSTDSLIECIKDFLREGCGGHSLSNGAGDVIWYAEHPINISVLASNIKILQNGQATEPVVVSLDNAACGYWMCLQKTDDRAIYDTLLVESKEHYRRVCKAVLDAAGVKYE